MTEDIFNMDLENVEELKDFSAVKPGPQRIRVTKVELGIAQSGNAKWVISNEYVNVDGLVPEVDGGKVGVLAPTKHLALTPKALSFVRRFVEAHGITWEAFKANRDPQQFVGLEAEALIGIKAKQDGTGNFNEIARYIVTTSVTQ